jgi:hypothetical protein
VGFFHGALPTIPTMPTAPSKKTNSKAKQPALAIAKASKFCARIFHAFQTSGSFAGRRFQFFFNLEKIESKISINF